MPVPRQKHQTSHEFRDLRIFENFDGGFTLQGSFGALQGATIRELYDQFVTVERLADWDQARNIHGDQTNQSHLARTEAQRRADAFEATLRQASSTMPDNNLPEPSVNIAMSPDAFEHGLATLTNTPTTPFDPRNYRNIRCETFGGTQLDPAMRSQQQSKTCTADRVHHPRSIGLTERPVLHRAVQAYQRTTAKPITTSPGVTVVKPSLT